MNDLHLPWTGQAEREADEQARRDAADLVAPDPVCTCEDYDEFPLCPIHVWIDPGVEAAKAGER